MTDFSKEQKQIIDEKNRNLLVSASAGSGKTTVMIQRIVRLIEEGKTNLNRILVLTFTNNSANDMKEKLYKKLSESSNKNCKNALFDVAGANISNIHQFCKRLIQKYFFVCDVDPAFSVISENEALVLKEKAFDKTINCFFYNNNEKLDAFLENNFEKRNFNKIKEMILSLFTFLSILDDPGKWLKENATKNYDAKVNENGGIKILCENAKFVLKHYEGQLQDVLNHITRFFKAGDFEGLINFHTGLKKLLENNDVENFVNGILMFKAECQIKNTNEEVKTFFKENVKTIIDDFKKDFKKIQDSFSGDSVKHIEEFLKSSKASGEFLCELAKTFTEEYRKIKDEKFLLDFDDLESKAKILLDEDKIKEEIRQNFDYCFVDEYQDINILQEAIISSVAKNSLYFGVGDAKQAIYGFRLCSPEIFIAKFSDYKEETTKNFATSLNKNFRSKINILRFANKVFDVIMTQNTAQIDYKNQARFQSDNLDETSKVNIKVILKEKEKNECLIDVYSVKNHDFSKDEDETEAKLEAEVAKDEIVRLVESGERYSDIAILSRNRDTNSFVKAFFNHLQECGIPVVASFRTNILTYKEISLVHNLMKLVNNFKDDVVLFKVLSFPFFKFSINELIEMRNSTNEKTFADCFIAIAGNNEKVQNFLNFYNELSLISQNMSVLNFAQHIIQTLVSNGAEEVQNENSLKHFESYLSFIKQINPGSLTDYSKLTESENMETSAENNANENAVSFCTIHSSKGLEYKHVILIGCGKKLNLNSKDEVLIDENVGLGLKGFNEDEEKTKTPIYNAIKIGSRKKCFAEEIRLLYVALTRAKESLTIIGSMPSKTFEEIKSFKNDFEILKTENFLELILRSFSGGEISKLKTSGQCDVVYEKNEVAKCLILTKEQIKKSITKQKQQKPVCHQDLERAVENWQRIINTQNVYLKNSVSSIMKNNQDEMDYSNSLVQNDEKSSTILGTKYHEMFSKLTFANEDLNLKIPTELNKKYFDLFFDSELYHYCKGKKIMQEVPFLFYDCIPEKFGFGKEKILLQGIIDLLIEEDDGFIVVDYKASSARDDVLINRYRAQLELYAFCAEKMLNKKCKKKLIYKIFNGKTVEIE